MSTRYTSLFGGETPTEMIFVVDPPSSIGRAIGAWTNHRADGPTKIPISLVVSDVLGWVMGGFVLGLVGAFAVGGWLEHEGQRFEADWFLYALAIGSAIGALVGALRAMRKPNVLTLFVGERGCVQISGRAADAKHHLTLWDDVEALRTEIDVMRHQGITTKSRLVYIQRRGQKKETLWYLSKVAEEAGPDDPQFHFAECVLRSFAARARS